MALTSKGGSCRLTMVEPVVMICMCRDETSGD